MKRFIFQIIVFFAIIFVIDIATGKVCEYLQSHAKGGDNGRNNYICNQVDADILVFGSSRAFYHYNPQIITDSLGKSCYNCGRDGNGIILNYAYCQLINQRSHPNMVIYDIMPTFDLLEGEDNHKYLKLIKSYYDGEGISEVFESVDPTEKYKMQSLMYRYNSNFIQIVSDFIHPFESHSANGFRPVYREMDTMKINTKREEKTDFQFDTLKISYIKRMIDLSNETKFIFVVSPIWYGMDTAQLRPIIDICKSKNIPLVNFSNNQKYVHNNEYFYDGGHMNAKGADEFTRDLIKHIKPYINASSAD